MELHNLKPAARSTKSSKRIGRGEGSGKGGTSTKGHKGAQSRSGYSRKIGFEGGQMPLYRLVPKRGFKNINRVEYSLINLTSLQALVNTTQATEIDLPLLIEHGLISKKDLVKVLGNGTLESKINISVHAISKSAKEAIEKLGGTVTIIGAKAESEETPEETPEN